jgi:hypothetical protein
MRGHGVRTTRMIPLLPGICSGLTTPSIQVGIEPLSEHICVGHSARFSTSRISYVAEAVCVQPQTLLALNLLLRLKAVQR